MAKQKTVPFDQQLKQALKYYNDPDRLATDSVLATAYFLGWANDARSKTLAAERGDNELHWGKILCQAMLDAADGLWGESPPRSREEIEEAWANILQAPGAPRYNYLILELRYFRRFFQPRSLQQLWEEFLGQSRAEFYRDVDRAIEALGDSLLRHLRPGARQERPPSAATSHGRAALQDRIQDALRDGKSVALSGLSGIGKTSLAASIVDEWSSATILWFTVRPELNDGLYQFLFTIGGFLHQNGQDRLWRALAASKGQLEDPALLLTLVQSDFTRLAARRPLLILDEVDLWSDSEGGYRALQEFIAGLQEVTPMLMVGQRVGLAAHTYMTLTGLDDDTVDQLFQEQQIRLTADGIRDVQNATGGNPRLLWLCMDLLHRGESLESILGERAEGVHSFDSFLNLLWLRLGKEEREAMHALCVYPAPAPGGFWSAKVLEALATRHLLYQDDTGSVSLLPSVRTVLYRTLSAEQRERLHQQAAGISAALGDYTMAAYHFQKADQPELAVKIWYPHRSQEIERGGAAMAAVIFNNVSGARLSRKVRLTLDVLRAELFQLSGDLRSGLDTLGQTDWRSQEPSELAMEAQRLSGDFEDALGQFDHALASYADSLAIAARLQQRMVELQVRRGMVHVRQRQIGHAQRAVQQARCQTEYFQGLVLEEQGDLSSAERHYSTALELAEALGDDVSLAEINRCLSNLFGRRGELEKALQHADQSIAYYQQIGDLVKVALIRSNMAANYLDAGRYSDVLATGKPAFDFYQQISHTHGTAATACNLAEASFELGDEAEAERYVRVAIEQEEPMALPYALYTLALVRHAQERSEDAQDLLHQCCSRAKENEDIFIEGYARLKLAEILQSGPAPAEKNEAAARAADIFKRLGLPEMVHAAENLAENQVGTGHSLQ